MTRAVGIGCDMPRRAHVIFAMINGMFKGHEQWLQRAAKKYVYR